MREAVADEEIDDQVLDSVELLTSEVVTNAMIHARSPAELVVRTDETCIRVEIIDDDPSEPRVRYADELSLSGRGLFIVDAVASDWGVEHLDRGGKRVWFEVATNQTDDHHEPRARSRRHLRPTGRSDTSPCR